MSTFRHTIQALITVFATITCSSGAAAATPYPELDSVICTLMRRYDLPAASIALMRDDHIIYTAAYGVTDTLRHTPTTIRTRFRIASLSKPVTMAGILLLAAQGGCHSMTASSARAPSSAPTTDPYPEARAKTS